MAATALAALVGQKHAADLILTGRSITGTEAASIGLANRAVAEVKLDGGSAGHRAATFEAEPGSAGDHQEGDLCLGLMHFDKGLAQAEKIYLRS